MTKDINDTSLVSLELFRSCSPPPSSPCWRCCTVALDTHELLLSSKIWPILSMSRGVINSVKQRLSHPLSQIKSIDQWAVDPDPFLTLTTSAKIGKTAIALCCAC